MTAVTGEVGELANNLKKVRRGDFTVNEKLPDIADEIADIIIYLDILAKQLGIDLNIAIPNKFNNVSFRVRSSVMMARKNGSEDWVVFDSSTGDISDPGETHDIA